MFTVQYGSQVIKNVQRIFECVRCQRRIMESGLGMLLTWIVYEEFCGTHHVIEEKQSLLCNIIHSSIIIRYS